MSEPTFKEILDTVQELAREEQATVIVNSIDGEFPRPKNALDARRYDELIRKAGWVLKERTNSINELVRA